MTEKPSTTSIDVNQPAAILAACLLSAIGVLVFNIMPLFLGSAAESLNFDEQQLGFIASSYLGGFTLASFSAVFWARRVNWRKACLPGIVVGMAAYSACLGTSDYSLILLLLFCAGCAMGSFFAISLCSLGDTRIPDRAFGFAVLCQLGSGALGLILLPSLSQRWGFDAILVAMAGVTALVVVLLRWLPAHGAKEEAVSTAQEGGRLFPVFVGLAGMLLLMTGMTGVWAFLERLGAIGGLEAGAIGSVLSATMVAGGIAALLVSCFGDRFGRAVPFLFGTLVMLVGIWFLSGQVSLVAFAAGGILLMGGWTFVYPYQMAAISTADSSGRFVPLIAAASGLGSALGPGVAGLLITDDGGFTSVLVMGSGCLLACLLLFFWLARLQKGKGVVAVAVSETVA